MLSIYFTNTTNQTLNLSQNQTSLAYGTWDTSPPATVAPQATGVFFSVDEVSGSQAGQVTYTFGDGGFVTMVFDDPAVGPNIFTGSASSGYTCLAFGQQGDDAWGHYTLANSTQA